MNPDCGQYAGAEFEQPVSAGRPERLYRRVKWDARRALTSRWGKAAAGILFLAGCQTVFFLLGQIIGTELGLSSRPLVWEEGILRIDLGRMALDGLMLIPSAVLMGPLMLGYLMFIYRLTSGEEATLGEIFQPLQSFKLWVRSVGMLVLMTALGVLSMVVGLLPGGALIYFTLGLPGNTGKAAVFKIGLLLLAFVLLVAGAIGAVIFMVRFIPAPFLLAAGNGGVFWSLSYSVRVTKGFRSELFTMVLSFVPLMLLMFFMAPVVFVLPYMLTSFGLFSRFLSDRLKRKEEHTSPDAG